MVRLHKSRRAPLRAPLHESDSEEEPQDELSQNADEPEPSDAANASESDAEPDEPAAASESDAEPDEPAAASESDAEPDEPAAAPDSDAEPEDLAVVPDKTDASDSDHDGPSHVVGEKRACSDDESDAKEPKHTLAQAITLPAPPEESKKMWRRCLDVSKWEVDVSPGPAGSKIRWTIDIRMGSRGSRISEPVETLPLRILNCTTDRPRAGFWKAQYWRWITDAKVYICAALCHSEQWAEESDAVFLEEDGTPKPHCEWYAAYKQNVDEFRMGLASLSQHCIYRIYERLVELGEPPQKNIDVDGAQDTVPMTPEEFYASFRRKLITRRPISKKDDTKVVALHLSTKAFERRPEQELIDEVMSPQQRAEYSALKGDTERAPHVWGYLTWKLKQSGELDDSTDAQKKATVDHLNSNPDYLKDLAHRCGYRAKKFKFYHMFDGSVQETEDETFVQGAFAKMKFNLRAQMGDENILQEGLLWRTLVYLHQPKGRFDDFFGFDAEVC